MSELYNSQWTGAQIDAAIGDVRSNKVYWNDNGSFIPTGSGGLLTADGKNFLTMR